jgi:hypothetical protein
MDVCIKCACLVTIIGTDATSIVCLWLCVSVCLYRRVKELSGALRDVERNWTGRTHLFVHISQS